MTSFRYSFQGFEPKTMVMVSGKNMPISHKQCYEIANFIRHKQVDAVIKLLENVIVQKRAVPYRRFNRDICHKAGKVGPGRYPKNASLQIIGLLKNLKGQAQDKGIDTNKLVIIHAAMQKGAKLRHYGRKMGLVRKNTHFELVGKEMDRVAEKKQAKQTIHSLEHKTPTHPEAHAAAQPKTHEHSPSSQTRAEQSSAGHSGTSSASAATGVSR
ncbi:MAG: 50S ribosomal protein L22 [archaeon]